MPEPTIHAAVDPAAFARVAAFFATHDDPAEQAACERQALHPRYRPAFTRYIEQDRQIVCAALLRHDRWLIGGPAPYGAVYDVGHVANILTHPAYRRRGLFRALLTDCLRVFQDEGLPLASLHGPIALYAPFGYLPVRWHAQTVLPMPLAGALPAAQRARALAEDDLPAVAALYDANYARLAASAERTAGVWRWLWPDFGDAVGVEDASGALVAYAVIDQTAAGRKLRVTEAAAADTQSALLLLAALGAEAERRHAAAPVEAALQAIYLPLPADHPVAHAALLAGGEASLVAPLEQGSKFGHEDQALALDAAAALRSLAPVLARRLADSVYAGWSGALGFDTEQAGLNLQIGPAGVRVARRDPFVQDAVYLPSPLLAPLFLGTYGARDLSAWPGVRISTTALGLLASLFPPLYPISENENWCIAQAP